MRGLQVTLAALMASAGPVCAAESLPSLPRATAAPTELFVELVVNGQAKGALVALVQENGHLWVDAAALREAGLAIVDSGRLDLSAPQAFRATYDAPGQRLLLDVPPALLPTRRIAGPAAKRIQTSVDAGALLNYDLFVQTGQGHMTAALLTEQRIFGAFGTISNSGVLRSGFAGKNGYLRYDTRYHRVFEDSATELTAGDLITRTLPWTTAVRLGGIQIARNFAVRPDLVTVPLPSFAGEASVPSGVDLFVNGYRQSTADVAPGRFVLDSVPVVNGAGEARVVTTDAVGRQVATVIPFYVAPELLRPGLTDFAVEMGLLRRGYGTSSFGYRRAAASASARHGLTSTITLSGHAEAAPGLGGVGVGAAWRVGLWGAVHGSAAVSDRLGRRGSQVVVGYSYDSQRFSIGAEHSERSDGFADLGSFDLRHLAGNARSDRVSGSVIISGFGSVGIGFVASRFAAGDRARLLSGSASLPIGRQASAFAAVDYDFGRQRMSAQLRIIVPLGRGNTVVSGGVARDASGTARLSAALGRAVPTDGGLGYNADAAVDSQGQVIGQVSTAWRARRFEAEAGASTTGASSIAWVGVAGSLVLLDHHLFVSNQLPDAFALVATGAPNVPVMFENQRLGVTDARGHLFVRSVTPYHASRFAIDPTALPINTQASQVEKRTAIRPGAGAIVRLPVRSVRSVTVHLVDVAGTPLPPGTLATMPSGATLTVGWDGVLLLEDAENGIALSAQTRAGACTARVTIPSSAAMLADLGAVRCE